TARNVQRYAQLRLTAEGLVARVPGSEKRCDVERELLVSNGAARKVSATRFYSRAGIEFYSQLGHFAQGGEQRQRDRKSALAALLNIREGWNLVGNYRRTCSHRRGEGALN